jgi:hypothetical protein
MYKELSFLELKHRFLLDSLNSIGKRDCSFSLLDFGGRLGEVCYLLTELSYPLTKYVLVEIPEKLEIVEAQSSAPEIIISERMYDSKVMPIDVVYVRSSAQYSMSFYEELRMVNPKFIIFDVHPIGALEGECKITRQNMDQGYASFYRIDSREYMESNLPGYTILQWIPLPGAGPAPATVQALITR